MAITTTRPGARRDTLETLAQRIRQAVLRATEARDPATKEACWDDYRRVRGEALALLSTLSEGAPD